MRSLPTFKTDLLDHQRLAVDKLSKLKVGALYMDMGTGKTRTALELALKRIADDKADVVLWLCPVSVKQTIADEIDKHLSGISYKFVKPERDLEPATIYIAGIESLSSSISLNSRLLEIAESKRIFLIVDESSLIKNHRADRTLAIWRLGERSPYRLILNGTPLVNNEKDLFSQWYFLDKRILGYTSFYSFAANHLEYDPERPGRIVRAHKTDYLVKKISPYTYQVRKQECLSLPKKSYSDRYFYMTIPQRRDYDETKEIMLQKLCDFSERDRAVASAIYEMFTALQKITSGRSYLYDTEYFQTEDNPRIHLLLETIDQIPDDAKVIIWCKYRHEIEDIRQIFRTRYGADSVAEFWGGISQKKRINEELKFRSGSRFLIANKHCAAFGLNLQYCQYAIYYDNDFCWGTRSQSEERIHRHGQTGNVHIIDLICNESIDARIQNSLLRKENLVDSFKKEIDEQKNKNIMSKWLDGVNENICN